MSDSDLDFEVHDDQGLNATFRNGQQAMLWAHLLLAQGGHYIRVVENAVDPDAPAQVSWRFNYGNSEMPEAVKED